MRIEKGEEKEERSKVGGVRREDVGGRREEGGRRREEGGRRRRVKY